MRSPPSAAETEQDLDNHSESPASSEQNSGKPIAGVHCSRQSMFICKSWRTRFRTSHGILRCVCPALLVRTTRSGGMHPELAHCLSQFRSKLSHLPNCEASPNRAFIELIWGRVPLQDEMRQNGSSNNNTNQGRVPAGLE
jgi:hypothetical protein